MVHDIDSAFSSGSLVRRQYLEYFWNEGKWHFHHFDMGFYHFSRLRYRAHEKQVEEPWPPKSMSICQHPTLRTDHWKIYSYFRLNLISVSIIIDLAFSWPGYNFYESKFLGFGKRNASQLKQHYVNDLKDTKIRGLEREEKVVKTWNKISNGPNGLKANFVLEV